MLQMKKGTLISALKQINGQETHQLNGYRGHTSTVEKSEQAVTAICLTGMYPSIWKNYCLNGN